MQRNQASMQIVTRVGAKIEPDQADLSDWFVRYRAEHSRRIATDLEQVARYAEPNARVLEYGAVPLLLTAALADRGYLVSAVDLAPERFGRTIAELGLDVAKCDIETEPVPFASESFDLIVFNELFEHLRIDPIFTLEEVRRVLKPGGRLLLSTPNLRSFRGIRNLALRDQGYACSAGIYRQYEKLRTIGHMGHVREYTRSEIADFLHRIGLKVEHVEYRGGHGKGAVGLAERAVPRLRPAMSIVAVRTPTAQA